MRPKLSYANVVATLALFVALGGASYAAIQLPKNSVGAKQIKRNAVSSAKIKNRAVTGAKIDLSTLGKVPSAAHADSADAAKTADQAGTATSAANAANSERLGGDPASSYLKAGLEAVHVIGAPGEPPFLNGAENLNASPEVAKVGFYKDPYGIVHLQGQLLVKDSKPAFTLPPGFRPQAIQFFNGIAAEANGELRIEPDGDVQFFNAFQPTLGLVSFRTDQ